MGTPMPALKKKWRSRDRQIKMKDGQRPNILIVLKWPGRMTCIREIKIQKRNIHLHFLIWVYDLYLLMVQFLTLRYYVIQFHKDLVRTKSPMVKEIRWMSKVPFYSNQREILVISLILLKCNRHCSISWSAKMEKIITSMHICICY